MRSSPRLLPWALAVVVLTACGSTQQQRSSSAAGDEGGTSGALSSPSASASPDAPSGTTGGGGAPGSTGSTGSTTGDQLAGTLPSTEDASTSGGTIGSGPTGTPPLRTGLGVTATTITIGISYDTNGDAANKAIGANGITGGDDKANEQAIIDEINAKGGVRGRKLVPVFFAYDATSNSSPATQDQAACDAYTQDHKVLAALSGNLTDVLPACLKKAGVIQFREGQIVGEDAPFLQQYPNEWLLGTINQNRMLRDLVGSLTRQGYYSGWSSVTGAAATKAAKIGVLTYDPTSYVRAVNTTLLPLLKQAGHPVDPADVFQIHKPGNQADVSSTVAQLKTATLKFVQDGVDHVVFNDGSGLLMGLFATNAQSQRYYPRYGLTSGAGAQAIHDSGLVQSKQLNGMAGNGWLPTLDLPSTAGNAYATAETRRCLEILKRRTGQTYTSTNAASIALIACDGLFLLTKALSAAPALTPQGLAQGLGSLGHSYASPFLPETFLSPTRHDDAVRGWDLNWHSDCECVKYSSPHTMS